MKSFLILLFAFIFGLAVVPAQSQLVKQKPFTRPSLRTPPPTTGISTAVMQSYNWWKYINPTNVNYFASFTNPAISNYDTGVIAYSKKTALSLVGWINHGINMQQAESDDSLVHLEPLIYLEQLLVPYSTGDAGLQHIRNLKSLKYFGFAISGTPIPNFTDNGVSILAGLTNLQTLHLDYCINITDDGLKQISTLPNLTQLFLSFSKITDKGLAYLKTLTKLQILNIVKTPGITDDGVDTLIAAIKGMPSFQKLLITGTNITVTGRQKLTAAGISFVY
jgi:Leucine-rich repeat (LRR) protein